MGWRCGRRPEVVLWGDRRGGRPGRSRKCPMLHPQGPVTLRPNPDPTSVSLSGVLHPLPQWPPLLPLVSVHLLRNSASMKLFFIGFWGTPSNAQGSALRNYSWWGIPWGTLWEPGLAACKASFSAVLSLWPQALAFLKVLSCFSFSGNTCWSFPGTIHVHT